MHLLKLLTVPTVSGILLPLLVIVFIALSSLPLFRQCSLDMKWIKKYRKKKYRKVEEQDPSEPAKLLVHSLH